jgi:hypothetical protein
VCPDLVAPALDPVLEPDLLDVLLDDPAWVEEEFRAIIQTSWPDPPRGGSVRPRAGPRRFSEGGIPGQRRLRLPNGRRGTRPTGRQRSPPG